MVDWKRSISRRQAAEILTAIALILWRIWEIPLVNLWRDWITILAVYWGILIFVENPRLRGRVTLVSAAGLVLLYGWGQFPHLVSQFGGPGRRARFRTACSSSSSTCSWFPASCSSRG